MNTAHKLPSYAVEFLPLERRLIDRREINHPLTFLVHEKRYFARRQFLDDATIDSDRLTARPKK